jgi:hypothetical protein
MKVLLLQLYEPVKSIRERPYHFVVWWLVAIVFGLAGMWLPLLILYYSNRPVCATFHSMVNAGGLASFCVVILAEGIACNLVARKSGSSATAVGIRALFCIVAFMLTLIPVGIMTAQHVGGDGADVSVGFQVGIAGLAILLASYMYCFRFPAWGEKDVEAVRDEEDALIGQLGEEAELQKGDDAGVIL